MKTEQRHDSEAYHLLEADTYRDSDEASDVERIHSQFVVRKKLSRTLSICLWAQAIAIIVLTGMIFHLWQRLRTDHQFGSVYSPAQSLIRHVNIVSNSSLGFDNDPFTGPPTPERDALWEDLYNFAMIKIPIESAAKLADRTVPIPGDPGQYIISLDVFHELHCLNKIRHRLWMTGEPDPNDATMQLDHLDHCINMMRQNIMCTSDITPIPYIWDIKAQRSKAVGKWHRTCRDFDAIREWALEHRVRHFDEFTRVEDPLGNMEY